MYSLKKVLTSLPNNYVPIWFAYGYRGHAVQRILSAHKESAWESKWSNSADETSNSPLDFPECVSSFSLHKKDMSYKMSAVTVHSTMSLMILDDPTVKELVKLRRVWPDKFIFITCHPDYHTLSDFIHVKKYNVFLYCSDLDTLNRSEVFNSNRKEILSPYDNDNVCSIDVAKLFSQDYETFLEEYLMIVRWFDFSPRINAVRAFILRYCEREKFIENF